MFDSTNVADDPLGADLVGYYVDGIYATTAARVRQRFPSAVLVSISAIGTNAGIVGDVEPGCMTVNQAIAWVIMRRGAGFDPSLYVNEVYGWPVVRQAFQRAGVPEPHWWVADYDGRPIVPAGAVAKQYANPPLTHGHFDRSVVADYWPGVDGLAGAATHMEAEMTPELAKIFIHAAYFHARGDEPSQGEFDAALVKMQVSDQACGEGFNAITSTPDAKAYRAKVAALVANGIKPGPKGDPGKDGAPGRDGAPGKDAPQLPAPPAGVIAWLQALIAFFTGKAAA